MSKVITIGIVVVGVLGVAWYFFFASSDQQRLARMHGGNVVSDAKTLTKKAASVSGSANTVMTDHGPGAVERARQCCENLKRIESAKRRAAQLKSIPSGDVPLDAIYEQLGTDSLPKCPSGGGYKIGPVNTMVKCTIGSNGTVDTKDDHFIRYY